METLATVWLSRRGLDEDERREIYKQFGNPGNCRKQYRAWVRNVRNYLTKREQDAEINKHNNS